MAQGSGLRAQGLWLRAYGSVSSMSLPLVIERIFNAQPGCAFPEEMGKQTKIELTSGRLHKQKNALQAAPNMVTVHGHGARLYPAKSMLSFGYSLGMTADSGSARKEDKGQQKTSTMFPKLAAHAGTTFLGSIIAVTLMLLKGGGANKK